MRCFSLKGLLILLSVWHVTQQVKDLLENIHPSDENSFELNSFLQDVMKMKKSFKEIRNAVADMNGDEESIAGDHMNEDIDEYIYDEENLEAKRRSNIAKQQEMNNKLSYNHKGDRPSNDIYPHIYKGQADQDFKYLDKNLDHDQGIRFRRQLVENVQVEPQSSKGNIEVQGNKACMADKRSKLETTPNDVRETLMSIFSEIVKATIPTQEDISVSTDSTPAVTKIPHFQPTSGAENNYHTSKPINPEKVPQGENLDDLAKSEVQDEEKKKNVRIKIMEDGKIIKEYNSDDIEKENHSNDDLPLPSTISFHIVPTSEAQNLLSQKVEEAKEDKDFTKSDSQNFERDKSIDGTMEPETNENLMPNKLRENLPIFVGNKINNNYRLTSPEKILPRPYNNFDYPQHIDPRYFYVPHMQLYQDENNLPYRVNFRPQLQTFKIEDDQKNMLEYPSNNEYYQLRRLKSLNETVPDEHRKKRSIQEFLGLNNEDDYSEDLDFSTETSITSKIFEGEVNYIAVRSTHESTKSNLLTSSNIFSSTESSEIAPTIVSTTISVISISCRSSPDTMRTVTQKFRMKRAKKYRHMKKRKKLTHLQRLKPDNDNGHNEISRRNWDSAIISCKNKESDMVKIKPDRQTRCSVHEIPAKKSMNLRYEDNHDYDFPSLATNVDDSNQYLKYFMVPRIGETNADNMRRRNRVYQWNMSPEQNQMYGRSIYSNFLPFVPLGCYHQKIIPSYIHYHHAKNDENDFGKQLLSAPLSKQKCYTFNSRKLMTKADDKQEEKNIISINTMDEDKSKNYKDNMKKRTESDYGEEPDLSEGQTIKKHSKLKQYNTVNSPGKNFEDNYEFEESTKETSKFPESKEHHVEKQIKSNSEQQKANHPSNQLSFKQRLTNLKNKLFSSESNEIDKAVHDEQSYGANFGYINRIERQQEQAPYEHEKVLNPLMGIMSNFDVESERRSDPYCCPDVPTSHDAYINPSDPSSKPCKSHTCRWHFNPLSGTFEASSCPCDPCQVPSDSYPCPCPCPWDPTPPCNPCSCPCNPLPSITSPNSNDHEKAYSSIKERSNIDDNSPCNCEQSPCPNPNPCPDEPCPCPSPPNCEPCPCPNPRPCPCPHITSSNEEKEGNINENTGNSPIYKSLDIHLGTVVPRDGGDNRMGTAENDVSLSNGPNSYSSREHIPLNIPRSQFRQIWLQSPQNPQGNMFLPSDEVKYKLLNSPEIEESVETNRESSNSNDDTSSYQNINICPYLIDHRMDPYAQDSRYREIFEKSEEHDEKTDTDTQMGDEGQFIAAGYPHSSVRSCPHLYPTYYPNPSPYLYHYPIISTEDEGISKSSYLRKRADIRQDILPPEIQKISTSSNICPCVFGYFLPCPHSSPSTHYHSDISPHIVNDDDEVGERSDNGRPWIDSEISPKSYDHFANPSPQSPEEQSQSKYNYLACRPSIPLQNIFLSQPDSKIQHERPDSHKIEDLNDGGTKLMSETAKNDKRSTSMKLSFPIRYENINPNQLGSSQNIRHKDFSKKSKEFFSSNNPDSNSEESDTNYFQTTDFEPAIHTYPHQSYETPRRGKYQYLQPIIRSPTSPYLSFSSFGAYNDKKGKRKCPKPSEPLPPSQEYPPSCLKQQTDICNDMLAEKAKRVNAYLKNKFLSGQYSMNNMMLPRNKRQVVPFENSAHLNSEDMGSVIRMVRRSHGMPRKPLNRRIPQVIADTKNGKKHMKNDEEDITTESLIPYLINENQYDQFEEEELDPAINVDRKSRSFLSEETGHKKMKPEKAKDKKKKNNIELQDLHFAKEIIDIVINKVNDNPNLKIKIGNALNKKKIYEAESNQRNHGKECNSKEQAEYEEAKSLLRSVSCVLNKLVQKQIQEKLCEHLPSHLKNFLKHIVRPAKHRIKHRSNDKYHEDTFLFRASYPPEKLSSNSKHQLEANLKNLLNRYDQLDEDSKKKAAPVKSYISNHLDMLEKLEGDHSNTENPLTDRESFMRINEHPIINTIDETKNVGLHSPEKFSDTSMEKDLANVDLEREPTLEKVDINVSAPPKPVEEEMQVKLKKRDTTDESFKPLMRTKEVKEKTKVKNNIVSDKYKKLVNAAEEVRCKRKNEEKIGEAFGKKEIGDSSGSQNTNR